MWMATFADMATLLMAFFVLLVAFAVKDPAGSSRKAGEAVSGVGTQNIEVIMESPEGLSRSIDMAPNANLDIPGPGTKDLDNDSILGVLSSKANSVIEILERALAAEIALGKVSLKVQSEQVIVTVATYDTQGSDRSGKQLAVGEISTEDVLMYSKIVEAKNLLDIPVVVLKKANPTSAGSTASTASYRKKIIETKLSTLIKKGALAVTTDDRRVVISLPGTDSFSSGKAVLKSTAKPVLDSVVKVLTTIIGGTVIVEGHSDSRPLAYNEIHGSNWDLSSARAAAVAEYMLSKNGFGHPVMVSGLADTRPVADNQSPEGRALNRRIEIILD